MFGRRSLRTKGLIQGSAAGAWVPWEIFGRLPLKTRVNLIIGVVLIGIVLLGSVLVIRQARQSVARETRSTLQLAREMVEASRPQGPWTEQQIHLWLQLLERLGRTRHLSFLVVSDENDSAPLIVKSRSHDPEWFAAWVRPQAMRFEQEIATDQGQRMRLALVADPDDEIAEAWQESQVFLGLILLLAGSCFAALYWPLSRAFRPVDAVLEGLLALERGAYDYHLPDFPQPEWRRIAGAFNHCARVLEQARAENRNLTHQLLNVEERDRLELARELHDELGQVVSAIKMLALSIKKPRPPEAVSQAAGFITEQADHLFAILRTMIRRLRPLILEDLGLCAALDALVQGWQEQMPDISIRFDCPEMVDTFPAEQQIHVYRIVQEALTNAYKHAEAKVVEVRLAVDLLQSGQHNLLKIEVRDDGRGALLSDSKGFGLKGMAERVASLGGQFDCATAPGQGFCLQATIPFLE